MYALTYRLNLTNGWKFFEDCDEKCHLSFVPEENTIQHVLMNENAVDFLMNFPQTEQSRGQKLLLQKYLEFCIGNLFQSIANKIFESSSAKDRKRKSELTEPIISKKMKLTGTTSKDETFTLNMDCKIL